MNHDRRVARRHRVAGVVQVRADVREDCEQEAAAGVAVDPGEEDAAAHHE